MGGGGLPPIHGPAVLVEVGDKLPAGDWTFHSGAAWGVALQSLDYGGRPWPERSSIGRIAKTGRSRLGCRRCSDFPAPFLAEEPMFEVPTPSAFGRIGTSNIGAGEAERRPHFYPRAPMFGRISADRTSGRAWAIPSSTPFEERPPPSASKSPKRRGLRCWPANLLAGIRRRKVCPVKPLALRVASATSRQLWQEWPNLTAIAPKLVDFVRPWLSLLPNRPKCPNRAGIGPKMVKTPKASSGRIRPIWPDSLQLWSMSRNRVADLANIGRLKVNCRSIK